MDVNTIKRIIFRLFPEFTGRWHLPRWGRVVALPELPQEGDLSDRFYPHYAVDVQLLDEKGMEYEDKSPLQAVPLPVPGLGDHAGRLEPPAIGSIVELGFMFGQPDKPFIRCVLPLGFKLPGIKEGESRYQQRKVCINWLTRKATLNVRPTKPTSLNASPNKSKCSKIESQR